MMKENKSDKCEICGKKLIYGTKTEDYKELNCQFCGKRFNSNIFCEAGHYICDSCHSKGPIEIIERICEETNIKDPFKLADVIMKHPNFKVYGPEHHVLTPAVILTSLKNNNIKKPDGNDITIFDIKEAIRRASKIPGGWCGFYGSCGAGIGSGVAISIFTGATPSTDYPRTLANQMTSRSLSKIADNLEHCCKRSVRLSILEALNFLKEKFNIKLPYICKKCYFSSINDKCEKEECPIF
ncbi:MAG: SAM-dependent methyltransferase [Promethearchaeota archaeon]|nr:MAG: SAM-dependent methyltransferase [Candidatus Lokiarchaeota archaeon]